MPLTRNPLQARCHGENGPQGHSKHGDHRTTCLETGRRQRNPRGHSHHGIRHFTKAECPMKTRCRNVQKSGVDARSGMARKPWEAKAEHGRCAVQQTLHDIVKAGHSRLYAALRYLLLRQLGKAEYQVPSTKGCKPTFIFIPPKGNPRKDKRWRKEQSFATGMGQVKGRRHLIDYWCESTNGQVRSRRKSMVTNGGYGPFVRRGYVRQRRRLPERSCNPSTCTTLVHATSRKGSTAMHA